MKNFWADLNKDRIIKNLFLYIIAFQGTVGIVGPLITKGYALKQIIVSSIVILFIFIVFEDNIWIVSFFYLLLGVIMYILSRNLEYIGNVSIDMSFGQIPYAIFKYIIFDIRQMNIPINLDICTINSLIYVSGLYFLNLIGLGIKYYIRKILVLLKKNHNCK